MQVAERNAPVLVCVHVTVPVGVLAVPAALSVTVAVHVDAAFTPGVAGVQLTATVVVLFVTVTDALVVEALAACTVSPG